MTLNNIIFKYPDQTHLVKKYYGDTHALNIKDLGILEWRLINPDLATKLEKRGAYILYDELGISCWWGRTFKDDELLIEVGEVF